MRLLLDTNALLWWLAGGERIRPGTRAIVADPANDVYVSAATAWEIAIKRVLGRLEVAEDVATWLPRELSGNRFLGLPISLDHALAVERLPKLHTDPFDRLIIAQAEQERLTIVTGDSQLAGYGRPVVLC
ncbi:MAG: type II toxin-antitoxin system VapC family toxin [Chloroflexota bacterium]